MVIMNEQLLLYRTCLFDSKHILSISLVVKNFSNISQIFHVARYAFQRKGMSRSNYQELRAYPCYPFSISVLEQEALSSFSKKHIMKLNINMKYKIIQFKNIKRCVPSSHNASITVSLHKTVK